MFMWPRFHLFLYLSSHYSTWSSAYCLPIFHSGGTLRDKRIIVCMFLFLMLSLIKAFRQNVGCFFPCPLLLFLPFPFCLRLFFFLFISSCFCFVASFISAPCTFQVAPLQSCPSEVELIILIAHHDSTHNVIIHHENFDRGTRSWTSDGNWASNWIRKIRCRLESGNIQK